MLRIILNKSPLNCNEVWVAIGPEGGWTPQEEKAAIENGWLGVSLGKNILRTSTASIGATENMVSWRRVTLKE